MKKSTKRFILAPLFLLTMLLFTGCSKAQDEIMIMLVKGDLDAMYLNQYDDKYLNMSSREVAK